MDFLDPKKEKRNRIMLFTGYCLIALAIGIATLVLLYQSYGYDIDRRGNVTQNGLVFVSSQPNDAQIYLNGIRYKNNTDTRVSIPAADYLLQVMKQGYREWQRPIVVNGGDVQHFDYPFLFPETLRTSGLSSLQVDPSLSAQSPDKRWLLLGRTESSGSFLQFDLKDPSKPAITSFTLPEGSYTVGDATGSQSWALVKWAADNQHLLVSHTYVSGASTLREYVLVNRDQPEESVNLTAKLKLTQADTVSLFNDRVSQFYVHDSSDNTLTRLNGEDATVVSKLTHVLAYKPYGDSKILYVSDEAPAGKTLPANQVSVVLQDGQKTLPLRVLPTSVSGYVLDLAQYSDEWYVVVGASGDNSVYIYRNPQTLSKTTDEGYPAPWRRLSLKNPSYVSFSNNTQYLLAESDQNFVVYDFENLDQYRYVVSEPLDKPQTHATWMDGARLQFVSNGKLVVFDYDYRNIQTLVSANPAYLPAYAPDYSYLYVLKGGTVGVQPSLTSTPLTTD